MQTDVLKIRNTVYEAIDDYFKPKKFCEVTPPILTSFSCEVACVGGSDLISVNYYDKKAFLSQSGQLYLEALAMQLERVYCIDPAFRAESTLLNTHLSEFWMCEAEMINVTFEQLVKNASDLLLHIIKLVIEKNGSELISLGTDLKLLEKVTCEKIPEITYSDAINILKNENIFIEWGADIKPYHESILSKYFNELPFIITLYPKEISSFYKQVYPSNNKEVMSFDIIAPKGYRELVGGSMRETDVVKLKKSLLTSGATLADYNWYIDMISSNPIEHGGYGLGIERLISWICNLNTIQEAIPFPRTEKKLCP